MKTSLFYSAGTLGRSTIGFVVSSWLLYFYVPPGSEPFVSVALFGLAMIIGRVIGAIVTPLIGYLSDNFTSRWGRRLPFLFVTGLPSVLVFVFLWFPPVQKESIWNLLYLTVLFALFKGITAFYNVPYDALLPEIASSEQHRVLISAYQSGFMLVGMVIGAMAGLAVEHLGYGAMAILFAAVTLVTFYLPVIVFREHKGWKSASADRPSFWNSLSITMKNRAFMLFTLAWSIYMMTTSLIQSAAPFIVTEVCQLNKTDTLYFYLPGLLASLASFPLVTRLTHQVGKAKVYAGSFLISAVVFPGTMLMGPWLPIALQAQCVSWAVLQSISISGMVVLTATFIAEITDHDYATAGQRREGMYFATMSVLEQLSTGVASLLLPVLLLLGRSRLSPQGPLGIRLTGVVGGVLMFGAFLIFLRYPLRHNLPKHHLKA